MNRKSFLALLIIAIAFFLLFVPTGCWFIKNHNPSGPEVANEMGKADPGIVPNLAFKFSFPPKQGYSGGPLPTILASGNATPTVKISLSLINVGNASETITTMIKIVPVDINGIATATFQMIPAQTAFADIHVEGGSISGWYDFHGAIDMIPNISNECLVSPKESRTETDIYTYVVKKIVSSPQFISKLSSGLVGKIHEVVVDLDLSSLNIYDDATSAFIQSTISQSSSQLGPNTILLDDFSMLALKEVNNSGAELIFANPPDQIKNLTANQILVGGYSEIASSGILRKIVSVSSDGVNWTFQTSFASLEETFQDLSVEYYGDLSRTQLTPSMRNMRAFIAEGNVGGKLCFNDSIPLGSAATLNASIEADANYYFKLDMKNFKIQEFVSTFDINEKASLIVYSNEIVNISKSGNTTPIRLAVLQAGPVTIPIYACIQYKVSGSADLGLRIGAEQYFNSSVGARYYQENWTKMERYDWSFNRIFEFDPKASLQFSAGPKLEAMIYGLGGPTLGVWGNAYLEVLPAQRLSANFSVDLGAKIGISDSLKLEKSFTPWVSTQRVIWEKQSTSPNSLPVVSIIRPVNGASYQQGTDVQIQVSANDSDLNGSVSKVEFYRGTDIVGNDFTYPFNFILPTPVAGELELWARAFDNLGAQADSTHLTIKVIPPPSESSIIAGIQPNPVLGSNDQKVITILGSNFQPGAKVRFLEPIFQVDAVKEATFVSSSELTVPVRFGLDPTRWSVQVKNPSESSFTTPFQFDVIAPAFPPVDGFDYPFGKPDGTPRSTAGWHNDQDFGELNASLSPPKYHMGEDWNYGAGDADVGLPVYSVADGEVTFSSDAGIGWNGVIEIKHSGTGLKTPSGEKISQVVSLYGHLDKDRINDWVQVGSKVRRGDQIGIIGVTPVNSTGPHLHFEIRSSAALGIDSGYSTLPTKLYWMDPSDFIDLNRPNSLTVTKTLTGFSIQSTGRTIVPGATLNLVEIPVTAFFSDLSNVDVTQLVSWAKISGVGNVVNNTFSGGAQPGTSLLRAFYSEGGVTKFSDFTITVSNEQSSPTITSVSPSNGSQNVSIEEFVSISFSNDMDFSTLVPTTLVLLNGSNSVTCTITHGLDNRTVILTPNSSLENSVTYTIFVSKNVKDLTGNSMGIDQSHTFSTVVGLPFAPDMKICGGNWHSLAIKEDGTVWGWGWNSEGAIGDGTNSPKQLPVKISSLIGIKSLAAGFNHTVALTNAGSVLTWGQNDQGQLGDGSITNNPNPTTIPGLANIVAVAANYWRSYALTADHRVYSWGQGIGPSPVEILGLSGIVAIAAGQNHVIALKNNGEVLAWGKNDLGQLGDGSLIDSNIPVFVTGLNDAIAIAAGSDHNLAIRKSGGVVTWGNGNNGQLGFGNVRQTTIVQPGDLTANVIGIGAGSNHSFAIMSGGSVMAWGNNGSGELGVGNLETQYSPVPIPGLTGVKSIVGGCNHSIAVKDNGTIWTWGNNSGYQLGDGSASNRATPIDAPLTTGPVGVNAVSGDKKVTISWTNVIGATGYNLYWSSNGSLTKGEGVLIQNVTSPYEHINLTNGTSYSYILTAIKTEGEVPTTVMTATPQQTPNAAPYVTMVLPANGQKFNPNSNVILAVNVSDSDGTISKVEYYEGSNKVAESIFTPFTTTWQNVPEGNYSITSKAIDDLGAFAFSNPISIVVAPPDTVDAMVVTGGGFHSIALQSDGNLWTWGAGDGGQLGDGTNTPIRSTPNKISLGGVVKAVGGYNFTFAQKNDGALFAWGTNSAGYLGDGTTNSSNVPIQILSGVNSISAGYSSAYAVKDDGTVLGWGNNILTPTIISGLPGITSVAVGDIHCLALDTVGNVWAWGNGYSGQLGDGGPLETLMGDQLPFQIPSLSNIVAIGAGYNNSFALDGDGYVWAWGNNQSGQLGDGTTSNNSNPRKVPGVSGIISIAGGQGHIIALKGDGSVYGWGQNGAGQLGNGNTTNCQSPVTVGINNVASIGAGRNHSLAITNDKKVWTWGSNWGGQLGNNSTTQSPIPVEISF